MARANDLTCGQAQQLLQRLLDRRGSPPQSAELREHLRTCQPCHTWQCLFQYEPSDIPATVSPDFAARVVSRLRREEFRRTWIYRGSLFATAAAVVFALFLGKILVGSPERAREVVQNQPRPDLNKFVADVTRDFETLPERFKQITPPSIELPDLSISLPTPDPWEASLPPLRSLGGTLQTAVEPLEAPAREAYQKVIEYLPDEADVQKWLQTVKKGM